MTKKIQIGFSLVELLIVIGIIGILSSVGLTVFPRVQTQARDSQRRSDIKQYQTALETFANANAQQLYPSYTTTTSAAGSLCTSLGSLIAGCPQDPKNTSDPSFVYNYQSDGTGGGTTSATKYVLWAKLETATDYWVVCSSGRSGTKAQSGFGVSGGACPL